MSCCKQVNKQTVINKFLETYCNVPEMEKFTNVLSYYNGSNADEIVSCLCLARWYIYNNCDCSTIKVRSYIQLCDDMIKFIEC